MKGKIRTLLDEINNIVDQNFDDLQDWKSVFEWPLNETRNIGGSINTKVYHSEKEVRFITYLPPGVLFPNHWHDVAELCRIIAGMLKDFVTGRVWRRDEIAIFSRGQKHIPGNPDEKEGTWLEVRFQNNSISIP